MFLGLAQRLSLSVDALDVFCIHLQFGSVILWFLVKSGISSIYAKATNLERP